jgi:hypothetical protein
MVPAWWGIEVASELKESLAIESMRAPATNPDRDPYLIAELLSKTEALEVLQVYGLAIGWRSKRIRDIHERLSREIAFDDLRAEVRGKLKRRDRPSRDGRSRDLNVPINRQTNPMFEVLGAGDAVCDLIDLTVGPAVR